MSRKLPLRVLCTLAVVAAGVPAQKGQVLQVQAPAVIGQGPAAPAGSAGDGDDVGVTVEMFENPNLDRYLRKAHRFLDAKDYLAAITVLQDVIEGRTLEVVESLPVTPGQDAPPDQPATPPEPKPGVQAGNVPGAAPGAAGGNHPAHLSDPSQAVFSDDRRLYRPVRRLCHELLATMPAEGLDLYRTNHGAAADRLFEAALESGELPALEQVGNRYFVTLAGGRAMQTLADRLLHLGRYRAAVQVLRDLLEVYPADNRAKLGIQDEWLRFKIALAMRMAGEAASAREAAEKMAADHPDGTLRIMGELQAVKDLPQSTLFGGSATGAGEVETGAGGRTGPVWIAGAEALVPLWQFRYGEPQPYRPTPNRNQNDGFIVMSEGQVRNVSPPATKYGTGTSVAFFGHMPGGAPESALFFDHFCLRRADAFTGLITHAGNGTTEMPPPRDNQPRPRVPVYDYAMLRPVEDDGRYLAVIGYSGRNTSTLDVLKTTDLVAYDKGTLAQAWSSRDWHDGDDGLRDVTFLAAPVVFGERLLLPTRRQDAYELQCLDRATGRPMWRTRLHAGGTVYFKAPAVPVRVQGGIAYTLTNAGGLAAVDAFSGELKWIRRYERRHPLRQHRGPLRTADVQNHGWGIQFSEADLTTFLPSDLIVAEGLVIFAPVDGEVIHCLDGATGQPVWMIDGGTRYQGFQRLHYLVGANSHSIYAATEDALLCIGLRSGVRKWFATIAPDQALGRWRGRGVVTEDVVLLPGARDVVIVPAGGGQPRRLPLPAFGEGQQPLTGPNNLFLAGPWLGVCYEGGLEVYSAPGPLRDLAAATAEPLARAGMLTQAGDVAGAMADLEGRLTAGSEPPERQEALAARLLELAAEHSRRLAGRGEPAAAVAVLDRVRPFVTARTNRLNWHLARLELFQATKDLGAFEREQLSLYRFMEGKEK